MKIFGIEESAFDELIFLLSQNSNIEKVVLFGSRAMGRYDKGSDIDLALFGKNVKLNDQLDLTWKLEKLDYPYSYDFQIYKNLKDPDVIKHIDRIGIIIYQKLPKDKSEWKEYKFDDVALINPSESLEKGEFAKKVAMVLLHPFTKKVKSFSIEPYNGGMKFRNGDTIIARITPSLENGKTAFIDFLDEDEIGFGSTEFIVLRERKDVSEKHFLYYFSVSPEFRDIAIISMTGSSGRQRVQTDVIREHTFLLPSLPEQKAIASVLSSLDDKIDLLHRQNKTLEEIAETLFRQWFIEEKDESWEEKKLEEMLMITSSKRIYYSEYVPAGIPFYRSKEIIELHNSGITKSELYISEERFNEINNKFGVPKVGDILMTSVGTLGVTYRVRKKDKFYFKDGNLTWFKDFKVLPSSIIYCWLNSKIGQEQLDEIVIGSTQSALTIIGLKNLSLKIPPKVKLQKYENELNVILEKAEINFEQIELLEKLRNTLLPKLMSGEIRVN